MTDDTKVAALKRELAAYVADGNEDRAEQVRGELARLRKPVRPRAEERETADAAPTETTAADSTPASRGRGKAKKG